MNGINPFLPLQPRFGNGRAAEVKKQIPSSKHYSDNEDVVSKTHHQQAMQRLNKLMKGDLEGSLDRFGLGTERSLRDFYIYSGLDCTTLTAHPDAINCVPPNPVTILRKG